MGTGFLPVLMAPGVIRLAAQVAGHSPARLSVTSWISASTAPAIGAQVRQLVTGEDREAYAKLSLKKYRPMAARNVDKKVFSGLL